MDYRGYDVGKATVYNKNRALSAVELSALTCSKCTFLLKEPQQVISCGHRYCKGCIDQMTSGRYVVIVAFLHTVNTESPLYMTVFTHNYSYMP